MQSSCAQREETDMAAVCHTSVCILWSDVVQMRIDIKREVVGVEIRFINGQIIRKYFCIVLTFALSCSRDCHSELSAPLVL